MSVPRDFGPHLSPPCDDHPLMRAVLAALADLSPSALTGTVRFLSAWTGLPAERRALLLRILIPDLSDDEVAQVCGVHRCTLYRWESYRRLKVILSGVPSVPKGTVDADGIIEAWLEEAG
jgi:hypothetical protein